MRSLLFVPGDSPRKMEKGMTSGADALIVDLEDSVGADRKAEARVTASAFLKDALAQSSRPRIYVRVNALDTALTDDDLDAVVGAKPDGILLPKAEGGPSITHLDAKITARESRGGIDEGHLKILALATETAAALFKAGTYGGASPRLEGLTWGAEDLSAALGTEANRDVHGQFTEPFRFARTLCIAGAAAAGVPAMDTVYIDFRNDAGLRRECEDARRDGFVSKFAIHPAQVAIINEVFTPTPEAIAAANAVIAAFAAHPGAGVVGIDGVMYDKPHLARAERLLARARKS